MLEILLFQIYLRLIRFRYLMCTLKNSICVKWNGVAFVCICKVFHDYLFLLMCSVTFVCNLVTLIYRVRIFTLISKVSTSSRNLNVFRAIGTGFQMVSARYPCSLVRLVLYVHYSMPYKDLCRTINPYVKLKISEDQTIF